MPSGAGIRIDISGTTATTGTKVNLTTAGAKQSDPNSSNNRVEIMTEVIPSFTPSIRGAVVGDLFQLSVPGLPGITFVTEVSTNLYDLSGWRPIDTNTLQGVSILLEYPGVHSYRERYFRVRLVP